MFDCWQGPPGMTVRGPPGPAGPPGQGWLDQATYPANHQPSTCGCNQSLLRLYVKEGIKRNIKRRGAS